MQQFIDNTKNSFKNTSACCASQIIVDKCPKHKNEQPKFMCTHSKCHQILCAQCIPEHQRLHRANNMRQMPLSLLPEIQRIYTKESLESELKELQVRRQENHEKPQQVVTQCIEQLLYGTQERREKQLKSSQQQMKNNYNTNLLIKMVQDDNEYSLKNNNYTEFKSKYFTFLNHLIQDIHSGKYQ